MSIIFKIRYEIGSRTEYFEDIGGVKTFDYDPSPVFEYKRHLYLCGPDINSPVIMAHATRCAYNMLDDKVWQAVSSDVSIMYQLRALSRCMHCGHHHKDQPFSEFNDVLFCARCHEPQITEVNEYYL